MHPSVQEPFKPRKYLELAETLAKDEKQREEYLRAAVSRSYYSVFLLARDKLGVVDENDVHAEVRRRIERRKGRTLKECMLKLAVLRKIADYDLLPEDEHDRNWTNNWTRHKKLVDKMLSEIQRL